MLIRRTTAVLFALLIAGTVHAGDSLWGTATAVPRADLVILDYGEGQYEIRIAGVDVPEQGAIAERARAFVSGLVLNKHVRMHFEYRDRSGQMIARLFTDDPVLGIRDVAIELVRAGFARRDREQQDTYKYGELQAAEAEAQKERRGLWAGPQ
jgi:endonuclease YncB( thermonuclease family)